MSGGYDVDMATGAAKIEKLGRILFPKYGIKDVASMVATAVSNRKRDGHVRIYRPDGGWSWFASPGKTTVTPSLVSLALRSDYRRMAQQARDDIYRELMRATESTTSEDEIDAALGARRKSSKKVRASSSLPSLDALDAGRARTPAQLDAEIAQIAPSYASVYRAAVREATNVELDRALEQIDKSKYAAVDTRRGNAVVCYGDKKTCDEFAEGLWEVKVVPMTDEMHDRLREGKIKAYKRTGYR
ncbi:MAG TPA: hypothetical protein VNZ44_12090 [Pyrinomonadaceae bacterium]|nr:hypothetical protein [Pyrinomonadaceae bacterium]